jgi:acetyl/propionyl-CoA carboxylase alpha subunit/acetyl-CoA carboxylase carboxyltransferase component
MFKKICIANRGEIAIRIARAAAELNIETLGVYSADDASSLHTRHVNEAVSLPLSGVAGYLDRAGIIAIARQHGCDALHPGYGFLSEDAEFAELCASSGIAFIGPSVESLQILGNKTRARSLARDCDVPLLHGSFESVSLQQAEAFFDGLGEGGAMVIKAVAGGGGRGMRLVFNSDGLKSAYERCCSEAESSFGMGAVYVEELLTPARHIEVQIVGDGVGGVCHFHERECSLQRRQQKVVEVAPSPDLPVRLRDAIHDAALRMAKSLNYKCLGTFEFLASYGHGEDRFVFLEANPRVQVEHTVTEEVCGVDLVNMQIQIAAGASLQSLGYSNGAGAEPRGHAIQLRVNSETLTAEGDIMPSVGKLSTFEVPSGPGIRVDSAGYVGYAANLGFDSLLAKIVVSSRRSYHDTVAKAYRALCEFKIAGLETNAGLLRNLLRDDRVQQNQVHTRFIDLHLKELLQGMDAVHPSLYFDCSPASAAAAPDLLVEPVPQGMLSIDAHLPGVVVAIQVAEGDSIYRGQEILVMEALKMEHGIQAPESGVVARVLVRKGDSVGRGQVLIFIEPKDISGESANNTIEPDLDYVTPKLAKVLEHQRNILDGARPEAVAKRKAKGKRMPRENLADLCDEGSFAEVGGLAVALRHRELTPEELVKRSPADGVITAFASANARQFGEDASRCVVVSFDPTVFAGTLGVMGSKKLSRIFRTTRELKLPLLYLAEGGGGRAGNEYESHGVSGIDHQVLVDFARLSGRAPLIGLGAGYCFGGNANLLSMCDIIIATEDSSIGVGGPALIDGTGLGKFRPEDIGPIAVQSKNGVVDVVVSDEREGVEMMRRCLSYFQGSVDSWDCDDQRKLRHVLPQNRLRAYDVMEVIETLADSGTVTELRSEFARNTVTALARFEGRPAGVLASDCRYGGGAIDPEGTDKANRFLKMCETFGLPVVFLCDCPGFLIGPEAEKQAMLRRTGDLLVTLVNLSVPVAAVVMRKAYGVGAAAMLGGSSISNIVCVAWPTAEYGHMGPEGNARLGFQRELAAIEDPEEQKAFIQQKVDAMLAHGDPLNAAMFLENDNVIDPADTRFWVMTALKSGHDKV